MYQLLVVVIWSGATNFLYLGKFPNPLADKFSNIYDLPKGIDIFADSLFSHISSNIINAHWRQR